MSLLFKAEFHDALRTGELELTFRRWKQPKVKAGRVYRVPGVGALAIVSIAAVPLSSVTDGDARRAGFADLDALIQGLRRTSGEPLTRRHRVFRVAFHRTDGAALSQPDTTAPRRDSELADVLERLARMDRLGHTDAWTKATLRLIRRHPRIAASRLAPDLELDVPRFKANVRKLKRLGLTRSHEVGYELTPRGEAVAAALERRRAAE